MRPFHQLFRVEDDLVPEFTARPYQTGNPGYTVNGLQSVFSGDGIAVDSGRGCHQQIRQCFGFFLVQLCQSMDIIVMDGQPGMFQGPEIDVSFIAVMNLIVAPSVAFFLFLGGPYDQRMGYRVQGIMRDESVVIALQHRMSVCIVLQEEQQFLCLFPVHFAAQPVQGPGQEGIAAEEHNIRSLGTDVKQFRPINGFTEFRQPFQQFFGKQGVCSGRWHTRFLSRTDSCRSLPGWIRILRQSGNHRSCPWKESGSGLRTSL